MRGTTPVRGPSSLRFGCWRRRRRPRTITSDEPGYRAAAARAAARLLHASITQAGPPDAEDASEAFADVGQAADVAATAAAAGGYGALRVDAARPLLEAAALAADWASRACVAAAAKATRETQQACMNRGDATQASKPNRPRTTPTLP